MELFDAHNHLQDEAIAPQLATLLAQAQSDGLRGAAANGTNQADWPSVARLAAHYAWVRPQFGLHPWHVGNRGPSWKSELEHFLWHGGGIGEVGLDRWMLDRAGPDDLRLAGLRRAPMEEQIAVFREQLMLAIKLDRPVSVHCLEAWNDLIPVIKAGPLPRRGFLLHAYSGPAEQIPWFAERGAYFSFNGVVLANPPTARALAFRRVPADRLLIETDAPAMPMPRQYQRHHLPERSDGRTLNHPANLIGAYEGLAAILGEPIERGRELQTAVWATLTGASVRSFTSSPAAANPKAPVTKTAVPKPLSQSSRVSVPGSGSARQTPSDQG
jgi:TatD DNase family protein